jgi:hypothetical protein
MSICTTCEGEMTEHISCLSSPIDIGGDLFDAIRWGHERESRKWNVDFPCRDCGTPPGGVHHPGCCVERCPACLGQALGCPCFGDPDDDLEVAARPRPARRRVRAFCRAHLLPRHHRR